ncbi:MAG: DUF4838 domain-containing protein [Capsulimonadaceae bacterium]|nr:DUF4838 domain-containing protein [Capsulimonadaceae bacterium]
MTSRLVLAFVCLPLAVSFSNAKPLVIVSNHASPYVIEIAPGASPAIRAAADELADVIEQSTGVRLPVAPDAGGRPALRVGETKMFTGDVVAPRPENYRLEEISIFPHNRDIQIGNDADRSALYSVHRFLELSVGARWYAPDEIVIPRREMLSAPENAVSEMPAFTYRDTDIFEAMRSPSFDAHLRLNGVSCPDLRAFGGANRDFAGDENFHELLPPSKYFAEHPEYFSLIDGKRRGDGSAQLCLTNPDVFQIIVDKLVARAQADPALTTLPLSPNDAVGGACQCPGCKASDEILGGPAGTELAFVNRVAAAVDKALPQRHLKVMTLAYQYLEAAPDTVRPADNVLICFCPIYACVGHGLQEDATATNVRARKNLEAWNAITKPGNLYIWHYAANFRSYLQPVPDWNELSADIKYYRNLGVGGIFVEGDYQSIGEMNALRTWLLGKLLWNPGQPVWPLIEEFCAAYYGAAGPDIVAYLHALAAPLATPGVHLRIYQSAREGVLTDDALRNADAALTRAEAHAVDDKTRRRVALVRLSLREVDIERSVPGKKASDAEKTAYREKLAAFIGDAKKDGIARLREGASTDQYAAQMLAMVK